MTCPPFLPREGLELVLFGGKGGVGKTTCAVATALGMAGADPQSTFQLVSTDPAHSLADSLAGFPTPPNLTVTELDALGCLKSFRERHGTKLQEIARRGTFLDDVDIRQLLDLSLPGLDELMGFLEITRWVEAAAHRCIVVDTAPTGHTLRLLAMPRLMGQWLLALDALLGKHRFMMQTYRTPYSEQDLELDRFLSDLARGVEVFQSLVRDERRSRFVPVMLAEALSVVETLALCDELARAGVPVADVVVNRLHERSSCVLCSSVAAEQRDVIAEAADQLGRFRLWSLPVFSDEVRGGEALASLWARVSPLDLHGRGAADSTGQGAGPRVEVAVDEPAPPPARELALVIFGGKGGVGKTTLACATALRLARDAGEREVLLFSTDPAHSLSTCLDTPVGSRPRRVGPGLAAVEMDAAANFDSLKRAYADELARFLRSLSPNMDLTYDRQVMERILDLAPPGLDEVMAVTDMTRLLAKQTYRVLVVDSAPTGHLLRLLQMPEILDRWLKVVFGIFLKYRSMFHLPGMSQRLVQISRDLKGLRRLLADRSMSALYVVTIPTEMALAETRDLVDASRDLGISVPLIFVNMVTPRSQCDLCLAISEREQALLHGLSSVFPNIPRRVVLRGRCPRGVVALERLGLELYGAAVAQEEVSHG